MTYHPLTEMINTGPATVDHEGSLVESGEFTAAVYEAWAASQEAITAFPGAATTLVGSPSAELAAAYAETAERLAGDIWERDLRSVAHL